MKWTLTIGEKNRGNTLYATMTRKLILYQKMVGAEHVHGVPRSAGSENISSVKSQTTSGSIEFQLAKNNPNDSRPARPAVP
jgi:hypothetical protein